MEQCFLAQVAWGLQRCVEVDLPLQAHAACGGRVKHFKIQILTGYGSLKAIDTKFPKKS